MPKAERLHEDAADEVLAVVAAADGDGAAEDEREQQHEHQRLQGDVEQLLGDLPDVLRCCGRRRPSSRPAASRRVSRIGSWTGVAVRARRRRRAEGAWRWRSWRAPRVRGGEDGSAGSRPVRIRKTSSRVAWRRLRSTASMPASSRARTTSMRRTPSRTGTVTTRPLVVERRRRWRRRAAAPRRRRPSSSARPTVTSMRSLPMRALSSSGVPWATVAAVVEHDDVVGQAVGLFEVLGGEHDRGAVADEVAEHVPQVVAAARVEAGGGLVEEQHLGRGHEAGGQVEAPAHAAGERLDQAVGRVGEVEPLEQLVGPAAGRGLGQVVEAADHLEVGPRRSAARRRWPAGRPRRCGGGRRPGSATTSAPATVARPSVGADSVVRMRMAVVLPAPLWPSSPSTVPGGDLEVEVAQRPQVAVALAEAVGGDAAPAIGRDGEAGGTGCRMLYCCFVHGTRH